MRLLIGCGTIILLSGCASLTNSYTDTVQSWRGGSASTLIKRWGKPDIKLVGQSGNTFYIYRSKVYPKMTSYNGPQVGVNTSSKGHPVITMAPPASFTSMTSNTPLYCVAAFEVTAKGQIVGAETKGSGCYGSTEFEQRMRNPQVAG